MDTVNYHSVIRNPDFSGLPVHPAALPEKDFYTDRITGEGGNMKKILISLPEKLSPAGVFRDILAGLIIALVSIPISMGYADISGLPMVKGLYGSLLPILVFGLLTSTKNFVFGVDAAPAALIAGTLSTLGIAGSEAERAVPVLAIFTTGWLLLFGLFRAGRIVRYISTPVMGGFITGICFTIILMQLPKLWNGRAGTGELFHLFPHIAGELKEFHLLSFILGIGTILVILIMKRILPGLPMTAVIMIVFALLSGPLGLPEKGVRMLPETASGLPEFSIPVFRLHDLSTLVFPALTLALVITAETLLASRQNALTDGEDILPNREIFSYAAANLLSGLSGSCPVNGSVSRTGIARSFGARSQIMSLSAAGFMSVILLFCTGMIAHLPVPVLTGIVISALISASELHLAIRLLAQSRKELFIFLSAFFGVLIFGTVRGVAIGVGLSFIDVLIQTVTPPRSFLGCIPGREGFYNLERHKNAHPIAGTVIYRFNGTLFFANIDLFQQDIERAIRPDTQQVIVYASGMSRLDISAADRLLLISRNLKKKGIRFFITEQDGHINEYLHLFGADELLAGGVCRISLDTALRAAGLYPPYPLELSGEAVMESNVLTEIHDELEWAFPGRSEEIKKLIFQEIVERLETEMDPENIDGLLTAERSTQWGRLSYMDEDEFLHYLTLYYSNKKNASPEKRKQLLDVIEKRRTMLMRHASARDPGAEEKILERRKTYKEII